LTSKNCPEIKEVNTEKIDQPRRLDLTVSIFSYSNYHCPEGD
jgi:hypothetical protein